jgi:heme-degrading monooxygenase HmoA
MNRFRVKEGQQAAFEKCARPNACGTVIAFSADASRSHLPLLGDGRRWAVRESILAEQPGFFGFYLMRRDGGGKAKNGGAPFADESFNYSTCTVWGSKAAFEVWRDGPSKSVHAKSQSVSRPLWPSNV